VAPNLPWSIILAGGEGQRTSRFIQHWLGRHLPKQYCVFSGDRSLFQMTVDRADRLGGAERRVVVAAESHREIVAEQLRERGDGTVVFQPANRGTAPGVFLPLTHVMAADPEATVVIHPSDHFIRPVGEYVSTLRDVVRTSNGIRDRVVLMGARPESPDTDFGWIRPAEGGLRRGRTRIRPIQSFVEKPSLETAREIMLGGGLLNTFVLVARAETLWELGRRHLPAMMSRFECLLKDVGTPREAAALAAAYGDMPDLNLSKDLLELIPDRLAVAELSSVMWSDWGRPARIAETLDRIGATPAFPYEALAVA